jgi:hypothetical protein
MAKLSAEKRAELEAMLAADDTDDDDFEIEIRDGDKAARVPYSKGRSYLQQHFGIDLDPEPDADDEPGTGKPGKGKTAAADDDGKVTRFGRRVS